ncbi:Integrase, catalytic core [Corchorus capsularis]|uniref:Integrase, catalytic core n=1 Tax=Corchorus capsularis TaxID=210143 RepID=A0A1R3GWW7_COCAP|nr:Integrase, catalytic core [Corchorus capsularis]
MVSDDMASNSSSSFSYPYPATLNITNFVSLKLNQTNFLLWKTQIMGLIESQDMAALLDGSLPTPSRSIETDDGETINNPKFAEWRKSDRLLRGWITGTLSEETLGLVVGLDMAAEVWQALNDTFTGNTQEHEFALEQKLHHESFVTTMMKPPRPTYYELISQLKSHEIIRSLNTSPSLETNPHQAFTAQRQGSRGGRGRGFARGGRSSVPFTSKRDIPQQLVALSLVEKQDDAWYPDTGATSHMTSDLGKLSIATSYDGPEKVMVGNGASIDISHSGSIVLKVDDKQIVLDNVLVVPDIKKNLISISQLTTDNPFNVEFSDIGFQIRDRRTGEVIATGKRVDDLYVLESSEKAKAFFSTRFRVVTRSVWHSRLGHPQVSVVQYLDNKKLIHCSNKQSPSHICSSCQMGKACRLSFLSLSDFSTTPFEITHCDLWGPSPVNSIQRFHFYVIFIDECTRFTWFFPLKHKSDFTTCFIKFHKFITIQFERPIKNFQSDGGGEFDKGEFQSYLSHHGIHHQLSCPRTFEQNGLAERKHCNITKLGLTMMLHASVPKRFWVEAFSTAVWLINRLPSKVLNMKSPFEKLFHKTPDYSSLRVFGSLCFPYLRDPSKTKLDPKSLPCVFLGYSHQYKGYRCFCPTTNKVYISRHVVFDEDVFPFQKPGSLYNISSTNLDAAVFTDWFPSLTHSSHSSTSSEEQMNPLVSAATIFHAPNHVVETSPAQHHSASRTFQFYRSKV